MITKKRSLFTLSDEEIARLVASGDVSRDDGVGELVARRIPYLWRYLSSRYRGAGKEVIEDAIASAALSVWENFERYDPDKGVFAGWAATIAKNELLQILRRKNVDISIEDMHAHELTDDQIDLYEALAEPRGQSPEEQALYNEVQKQALEIIATFPEPDRTLFFLKVNYDLTFADVAEIMNKSLGKDQPITPDALAQRFYRRKHALLEMLRKLYSADKA